MKLIPTIGLMSGTSMDGINGTLILTNGEKTIRTNLNVFEDYSKETKILLQECIKRKKFNGKTSNNVTQDHAKVIKIILDKTSINPKLIGFHGQTIFHDPLNKESIQLGNAKKLANIFRLPIISDFRKRDLKLGGQGAPIAPIYHKFIAKELNLINPCCFLNIGGISNITYVDSKDDVLIGFDVGPGNALMDYEIQKSTWLRYDTKGEIAARGKVNKKLVKIFFEDTFFSKNAPKSLDKAYFNFILNNHEYLKLSLEDKIRTLAELTVLSIKKSILQLPLYPKIILVSGGGTNNNFMMKMLNKKIKINIKKTNYYNLNAEYIEAEMIAFLAARSFYNLPITFPSTTGVLYPTSGGEISIFDEIID